MNIFVRINPRKVGEKFFRCGMAFTREWAKVTNADEATVKRLKAEQMLEVSDTQPTGYVDPAASAEPAAPGAGASNLTEADQRKAAIKDAIGQLDKANQDAWAGSGKPTTTAIQEITGFTVTAAERDDAWAELTAGAQ